VENSRGPGGIGYSQMEEEREKKKGEPGIRGEGEVFRLTFRRGRVL